MRVKSYTLTGFATSANAVALSQAPVGGVSLTLEAAAASISPARQITISSASDISDISFTVVGTNSLGNRIAENIVGSDGTPTDRQGNKLFASVTQILPNKSSALLVTAGWALQACTPWIQLNNTRKGAADHLDNANVQFNIVTGAPTAANEVTNQNLNETLVVGQSGGVPGDGEKDVLLATDTTAYSTNGQRAEVTGSFFKVRLTTAAGTSAQITVARPNF